MSVSNATATVMFLLMGSLILSVHAPSEACAAGELRTMTRWVQQVESIVGETQPEPQATVEVTDDGTQVEQGTVDNDAAGTAIQSQVVVPASQPEDDLMAIEKNIVHYTNEQRARRGLPRLMIDGRLMHSARRHAGWMARNASLRHTGAAVAENIAAGQSHSREAVADWMSSTGHRANILNSSHRRIGVAAFRGRDGQIYWVQQFLQ